MHSSTVLLIALIASSAPAIAAPVATPKVARSDLDARASGLSDLAISALKGLATGGGLAALTAGAEDLFDPSSSTTASSKRELSAEDIALLKRASGLGSLGISALKGLATGGGLAALEGLFDPSSTSSSSTPASSKRELSAEDIALLKRASGLGSLGISALKGLATGGGLAALEGLFDPSSTSSSSTPASSKRELSVEDIALLKRASGLSDLAISALKGLATGGGLAALTASAEHFLDPSSASSTAAPSSRRELTELQARGLASLLGGAAEDTIGDVLKKGAVSGIASAIGGSAVGGIIDDITGDNSGSSSSKRGLASLLGGAAEDTIEDVLKKSAVSGVASAVGGSVVGGLIDDITGGSSNSTSSKRQLGSIVEDGADVVEDGLADVLKKGAAGGAISGAASSITDGIIGAITGSSSSSSNSNSNSRRSIGSDLAAKLQSIKSILRRDIGSDIEEGLKDVGDVAGDLAPFLPLLAARSIGSDIETGLEDVGDVAGDLAPFLPLLAARGLASLLGGAAEDTIGDVLKKGAVSGIASAIGGSAVGGIIDDITGDSSSSSSKRELNEYEARQIKEVLRREALNLGPAAKGLIGTGVSLGASTLAGDAIDKIESLFRRSDELQRREALNLGSVTKGLIGTGVSLGASSLAGDAIDKIESLFRRSNDLQRREIISTLLAARSLNELD